MENGDSWKQVYQADIKTNQWPHRWYGDAIAAHFHLGPAVEASADDLLDSAKTRKLLDEKKLNPEGLYFFNIRRGIEGHVGFIRVRADGELEQWQYSGLNTYRGLATGDFRKWKSASKYDKQPVELYLVPEA